MSMLQLDGLPVVKIEVRESLKSFTPYGEHFNTAASSQEVPCQRFAERGVPAQLGDYGIEILSGSSLRAYRCFCVLECSSSPNIVGP